MTEPQTGRDSFVRWARARAMPLATTTPGSPLNDLEPLLPALVGRRLVGLGEATHGTREFFQLKHRLVELLVQRAGFTQFQIEASLPDAIAVDDYVQYGFGAVDTAISGMHFWVWDTEEVTELVEWLRVARGVRFFGVDLQFAPTAAAKLLGSIPAAARRAYTEPLTPLLDPLLADNWPAVPAEERAAALAAIDGVALMARTDAAAVMAGFLRAWAEFNSQPDIWEQRRVRDREMAANALGWLADERAVLWAHNQHVGRNGFPDRFPSMGGHLSDKLGDDYAPVGFAFGRGEFRAFGPDGSLGPIHVAAPPADSLEEALDEVGLPLFALTWDGLPADAREWLRSRPRTRSIGSGYSGSDSTATLELDPVEQYDVLIYVAETTAARPNPGGVRPSTAAEPTPTAELVNGEFTDSDGEGSPAGWTISGAESAGGYHVRVVEATPRELAVFRREGRWAHGRVVVRQRLDAPAWRGGQLELAAELARLGDATTGSARLLVDIWGPESGRMLRWTPTPTADGEWTPVELRMRVPDDAQSLTVAICVTGASAARVRAVTVGG